jgi:hypothetical protein
MPEAVNDEDSTQQATDAVGCAPAMWHPVRYRAAQAFADQSIFRSKPAERIMFFLLLA